MGISRPSPRPLDRREFLALTGLAAAGLMFGCMDDASTPTSGAGSSTVTVFRRSSRGKRASRATKSHNANKLYETRADALMNPAHPGDRSDVVEIVISRQRFEDLFRNPRRSVVDLRHV